MYEPEYDPNEGYYDPYEEENPSRESWDDYPTEENWEETYKPEEDYLWPEETATNETDSW